MGSVLSITITDRYSNWYYAKDKPIHHRRILSVHSVRVLVKNKTRRKHQNLNEKAENHDNLLSHILRFNCHELEERQKKKERNAGMFSEIFISFG